MKWFSCVGVSDDHIYQDNMSLDDYKELMNKHCLRLTSLRNTEKYTCTFVHSRRRLLAQGTSFIAADDFIKDILLYTYSNINILIFKIVDTVKNPQNLSIDDPLITILRKSKDCYS